MKRLNPETGKPYVYGEAREDGKIFLSYRTNRRLDPDGFLQEEWRTKEEWDSHRERKIQSSKRLYESKKELLRLELVKRGCACCGWNEYAEGLEWDHIRPSEKSFEIAAVGSLSFYNPRFQAELAKCQVLCGTCHAIKTRNPELFAQVWEMHHMHDDEPDEDTLEWLYGHRSRRSSS